MGSTCSFLSPGRCSAASPPAETGLGDLPESCVALVLSYLEPPQICRLAIVNRAFKRASSADFVWETKLPANYEDVVTRVFEKFDVFSKGLCKRDIYARLSTPNSLDGGTKKVWLDKMTGKSCMWISWNGLAITGIDDRRYWTRIPSEESRFQSVAYLQQIWFTGRWSSHFQLDHTASFSGCSWVGLGDGSVNLNTFMVGIRSLLSSRSRLVMANKQRSSAT